MKKLCFLISLLFLPCLGMKKKRPNEGEINPRETKRITLEKFEKLSGKKQQLLDALNGLKSDLQQVVNHLHNQLNNQELFAFVEAIIEKENNVSELQALLNCNVNPNLQNDQQQTIMYKLVEGCEDPTQLVTLLFQYDANPNIGDCNRETPLLHAVQYPNDSNTIKLLVDNGAHIDAFDNLKRTPILVLIANLENEQTGINIIKYMLSRGILSNFDLKTEKPLNNGSKVHIITKKLKELSDLLSVTLENEHHYNGMNAKQIAEAKGFHHLAKLLDPDNFVLHLGQDISAYINSYYKK